MKQSQQYESARRDEEGDSSDDDDQRQEGHFLSMGRSDRDATLEGALFKATFEEGLQKPPEFPLRQTEDFRLPPINTQRTGQGSEVDLAPVINETTSLRTRMDDGGISKGFINSKISPNQNPEGLRKASIKKKLTKQSNPEEFKSQSMGDMSAKNELREVHQSIAKINKMNQEDDEESKKEPAPNVAKTLSQKHFKFLGVFTDIYQDVNENNMRSNIRNQQHKRSSLRIQKLQNIDKKYNKTLMQRIVDFRFHPNKGFKLKWDMIIIMLSIYNAFVIPLQFAMARTFQNYPILTKLDSVIDWLFIADILLNFRTIYIDPRNDTAVSDSKKICFNYLRGRFIIDLLASVPFDFFASLMDSGIITTAHGRFFSMLKLTRLLRLGRMISYFQVNQNFKFGMKMLQMFIIIFVYLNLVACIWISILSLPENFNIDDLDDFDPNSSDFIPLPEKLKFSQREFEENGSSFRYNLMLFMTLFNILGNDISPTRPTVFWVSALLMLTGFLIVGYIIGEFSNILNEIYEADANNELDENHEMVQSVLQSLLVPENVQERVYKYLEPSTVDTDFIRSKKFFSLISDCQSSTVKLLCSEFAIQKTRLFNSHEQESQLKYFTDNIDLKVYLLDDIIVKQGDLANTDDEYVYFIIEGQAEVIQERRDFPYFRLESSNQFLNEWQDDPKISKLVYKERVDNWIGEAIKKNINGEKTASGKPLGAAALLSKLGQASKSQGGKSPAVQNESNSSPGQRSLGSPLKNLKGKLGSGSASAGAQRNPLLAKLKKQSESEGPQQFEGGQLDRNMMDSRSSDDIGESVDLSSNQSPEASNRTPAGLKKLQLSMHPASSETKTSQAGGGLMGLFSKAGTASKEPNEQGNMKSMLGSFFKKKLDQNPKEQTPTKKQQQQQLSQEEQANIRERKNYVIINELDVGNVFGEIAAISDLRRTSSVVAINSMVIGKMKISNFRDYMQQNINFEKKIKKKLMGYKDQNMKKIFQMIKNAQLFGQFTGTGQFEKLLIDIVCSLREDCYHHMDSILHLGEISDKLYFVTQGKVGIFVDTSNDYTEGYQLPKEDEEGSPENSKGVSKKTSGIHPKKEEAAESEPQTKSGKKKKQILLGYLNVGSNFNHISAILSQQSILTFKALGSNTQVASINKEQFFSLSEQYQFLEKYKQYIEQMYNETGKKYDFQRQYNHSQFWDACDMKQEAFKIQNAEPEPKEEEPPKKDAGFISSFFASISQKLSPVKKEQPPLLKEEKPSLVKSGEEPKRGTPKQGGSKPSFFTDEEERFPTNNDRAQNESQEALIHKNTEPSKALAGALSLKLKDPAQSVDPKSMTKFQTMVQAPPQSAGPPSEKEGGLKLDSILKLNFNPFKDLQAQAKRQVQKKEEDEEREIMKKLRKFKSWTKISAQIKFKNFIRMVIKRKQDDPDFLMNNFEIFAYVDKLQESRMARMINLKKIMARQMVQQNSLMFEIIEKMNNLSTLAQYKMKYGDICKEIDAYYDKIEASEEKKETFTHPHGSKEGSGGGGLLLGPGGNKRPSSQSLQNQANQRINAGMLNHISPLYAQVPDTILQDRVEQRKKQQVNQDFTIFSSVVGFKKQRTSEMNRNDNLRENFAREDIQSIPSELRQQQQVAPPDFVSKHSAEGGKIQNREESKATSQMLMSKKSEDSDGAVVALKEEIKEEEEKVTPERRINNIQSEQQLFFQSSNDKLVNKPMLVKGNHGSLNVQSMQDFESQTNLRDKEVRLKQTLNTTSMGQTQIQDSETNMKLDSQREEILSFNPKIESATIQPQSPPGFGHNQGQFEEEKQDDQEDDQVPPKEDFFNKSDQSDGDLEGGGIIF